MSPLTETIAEGLEALDRAIADDAAIRSKLRKYVQRLGSAWRAADGSASNLLSDPAANQLSSIYPQAQALIQHLATDLQRQRSAQRMALESSVRSFCRERQLPCRGQFPQFTVSHFVELSFGPESARTKVGTRSIQSLEWAKVRSALEREIARVWNRDLVPELFRDRLLAAHERLQRKAPSPTGHVLLSDVYKELRAEKSRQDPQAKARGRLSAYYKDEFCADLTKLWGVQASGKLPGSQLEFASIRRAEEGFSVVLPSGDIATYGFVRPRR